MPPSDWHETSRPYRILAHAIELKRAGKVDQDWMVLANQTEQALETDATLSDYGRFRLRGYQKAMRS